VICTHFALLEYMLSVYNNFVIYALTEPTKCMDWGTAVIYTCSRCHVAQPSANSTDELQAPACQVNSYVEEFVFVQKFE